MTCLGFSRGAAVAALALAALPTWNDHTRAHAQAVDRPPTAVLIPAPAISFEESTDSNSPAVWDRVNGRSTLFLFSSFDGWPTRQVGTQVATLIDLGRVEFVETGPVHGVWLEAIIPDVDGTWYGYYHNELPAEICGRPDRTIPRIGAARSHDFGSTWEDLGVILEAPAGWHDCASTNRYFVGGVGDFSVILDHDSTDLYFFYGQYNNREQTQGVAIGRMAWANRDRPRGKMAVWWHGTTWVPTRRLRSSGESPAYAYPAGVPIYRAADGWHDDEEVDAYWGPSVHWNTYLQQYVMLLNRAQDAQWRQEGIYVAFSTTLDDPTSWSAPRRLIAGGQWYPQVMGTEVGTGTDKVAGERARFFVGGRSQYFIQFSR